jgi:hypothetical protein
MDPRIFTRTVVVWTSDGARRDTLVRGERVKNTIRIGRGVTFELVDPRRIAATYTMSWDEFLASTAAMRQAGA